MIQVILVTVWAVILGTSLVLISEKIEYNYQSSKMKIGAVVFGGAFTCALSIGYLLKAPDAPFKGWIIFALYITAAIIAISSSCIDFKYKELPDSYSLVIAAVGLSIGFIYKPALNGIIIAGVSMFVLYFVIMVISKAMGGGDVKFAGALGLLVPSQLLPTFVLAAFGFGSVVAIILMLFLKKGKNQLIPFGPYIALGFLTITVVYWTIPLL